MGDSAIVVGSKNGCAIIIRREFSESDESSSSSDDSLLEKTIKSKLKIPSQFRQCEVKSPTDRLDIAIVAYGSADEREKIFTEIKNEMRSYLLSFYTTIPLNILSDSIGSFIKNFKILNDAWSAEVIIATWNSQTGCELYAIDSNGDAYKCFGNAIGQQKKALQKQLFKIDPTNFEISKLLENITNILVQEFDETDNYQLSWICDKSNGRHQKCDEKVVADIMKMLKY